MDLIKIGALWKGEKSLSGKLGEARLLVIKNKYKEDGDKRPDYNVFIAPPIAKQEPSNQQQLPEINKEDEIPF